jgi:hypothetical protein
MLTLFFLFLGPGIVAPDLIAVAAYVDDRLFVVVFVEALVIEFVLAFFTPPLVLALSARDDEEDFADVYRNKGALGDFQSAPITEGVGQLDEDKFLAAFTSSVMMFVVYFTEECSGQPHELVMNDGIEHYRYDHAACKVEAFAFGEFHLFPSFYRCVDYYIVFGVVRRGAEPTPASPPAAGRHHASQIGRLAPTNGHGAGENSAQFTSTAHIM